MKAICPGSQQELDETETLYCTCGLVAKGPCSVPVHDVARHTIPVERVAQDIDKARRVLEARAQERREMRGGPRMYTYGKRPGRKRSVKGLPGTYVSVESE